MHFRNEKDKANAATVLGTGLMQTTLFLEKLTIPIDFYKDYYLCNLEYFLVSLAAVTSYVLEG